MKRTIEIHLSHRGTNCKGVSDNHIQPKSFKYFKINKMKKRIKLKLTISEIDFITDALILGMEEVEKSIQDVETSIEMKAKFQKKADFLDYMIFIFETLKITKKTKKYWKIKKLLNLIK